MEGMLVGLPLPGASACRVCVRFSERRVFSLRWREKTEARLSIGPLRRMFVGSRLFVWREESEEERL
jgi:hypothetical protein